MKPILSSLVFLALIPSNAVAQITPDSSLGAENSVVESNGNRDTIQGGAVRNTNLFHSFTEFNVGVGREAYFANPNGIANIFSRVTGNNFSNIQGVLGVLGNANLYLINPNGILFGENARLDVNGSFFATTADSVLFDNGFEFSAVNPDAPPLLTINIPIGLRFRDNPAPITNRSVANEVGLQVETGQTLALVGGDIFLEGGNLTAAGGRIEIGSVAGNGEVSLTQSKNHWILEYDSIDRFGNIKLENGAVVDAGTIGGGEIQIQTANLLVRDGARITNRPLEGQKSGGNLTINASNSVELSGVAWSGNNNRTLPGGVFAGSDGSGGDSGNITIFTQKLTVSDGAAISGAAFNGRNGGNLTIDASNSVELTGIEVGINLEEEGQQLFISNLATGTLGGEAGNLRINTKQLAIRDGAAIVTVAINGSGGNSAIDASESVILSGTSGFISLEENPEIIEVPSALFADSVVLSPDSANQEPGSLQINTRSLLVEKGAVISASTFGKVRGGDLTINASEGVQLDGVSILGFTSGLYAQSFNTGTGGNLNVNTRQLNLTNGARIAVAADNLEEFGVPLKTIQIIIERVFTDRNFGELIPTSNSTGNAGNIDIAARSILINEGGQIAASSNSGNGGDISFQGQEQQNLDLLLLRNGSQISTRAGTAQTDGNGGNINIDAKFIVAFPNENNDITANAFEGSGGNIKITTEAIFGLEERSSTPPNNTNDIDASSEFGLDGQINITRPDVDPTSGLVELTQEVVDASKLIAQNVCTQTANSEFVDIGKGGLPQNPDDVLAEDMSDVGLVAPVTASREEIESNKETEAVKPKITTRKPPAQGWIWHEDGSVELVAYNPHQAGEQRTWDNHRGCQ